jgi:hypothetical protein
MRLRLKRFDVDAMKPFTISILQGRRMTGKSCLLRDLLYHLREHSEICLCMSPSESACEFFRSITPPELVHDSLSLPILEKLLENQRDTAKRGRRVRSVTVVLDDCTSDASLLRSPVMQDIFKNGRHQKLSLILTSQFPTDLCPSLRSQIDYAFCLRDPLMANKKRIHAMLASTIENFRDFAQVFDTVTANYGVFVVDNTCVDGDVASSTFWYRSSLKLPPYKMSQPIYYKLAKMPRPKSGASTVSVTVGGSKGKASTAQVTMGAASSVVQRKMVVEAI